MGSVLLVRREAADTVGLFDEDFFMFSEETDWCYRFRQAGWKVLFTPDAEFVHVGGASTGQNWNPMFREQVRGHLRFLAKHHGEREAERGRRLLQVSLRLRGWLFPGDRGRVYAETARWLSGSSVEELLAR
jgi:GT2 family glycosyltransferase